MASTKPFLKDKNNVLSIVIPLLIIAIPLLGFFAQYILLAVILICAVGAHISYKAKDKVDAGLFAGFGLTLAIVKLIFPQQDDQYVVLRTAAIAAFVLLQVVLLIGPWSRFIVWVRKQYKHRRHIGVTVFFLGAMHAAVAYRVYLGSSLETVFSAIFTFFGFIALYIFFILAVTSRDHVQNHFSKTIWSIIHTIVIGILAVMISFYFRMQVNLMETYGGFFAVGLPVIFVIFGLAVAPYSLAKWLIYRIDGWKQVHVLIYIAYIALMFHVWTGIVYLQPMWIQVLFWSSFLFVVGSHAYGWIHKWREDSYYRNRVKKINSTINENGKEYIGVATTSEFQPMKGQKFIVHNIPITIFLFKNQYKAISALCAHQKGPLDQGTLTAAGYVICPWHQYTFSVMDGKGPKGYDDRVPAYQTLVRDNIVYVSPS